MTFQKKSVKKILAIFDDDTTLEYIGPARFNQSENRRTNKDRQIIATWDEFHLTWYVDTTEKVTHPVESIQDQIERRKEEAAVKAEDYLDNPNFAGIDYGQPRFKPSPTQWDFDDFGLNWEPTTNGNHP